MSFLDELLKEFGDLPDVARTAEKVRKANQPPSTAANRSFRAQTQAGEEHLDRIFADANYADLPQDAYDQNYGSMLFHHVGKPDLNSYDLGASRKANELAPVGMWSYPEKAESDIYLRNRLKDYPDVPAGQTSVVTSAKNAFVVGADKPTEAMRKSFIDALERRHGFKYDELDRSRKGYVDSKINHFMTTGSPVYGDISGDEISKIYTDNGVDMLVNGREVVHLRPEQARKPTAMFDPMMKGENDLNAFTSGKQSTGILDHLGNAAATAGTAYMQSDDTDYGEDATSTYADVPAEIWDSMSLADKIALVTSPIPVVGGVTGVAADVLNMYNNPEERTGLNAALLASNFIPANKIGGMLGMIADAAKKKVDYRGWHTAPVREGSNSIDDLADIYPDDIYSSKGVQYYGTGEKAMDTKTIDTIKRMQGNPDAEITIYRAVPKGVKDINSGDWVTINKDYAKMHGDSWVEDGSYDIISQKVKAKDIVTNGDSIHEWGYDPVKAK